jgi:hypothetical protein
MNIRPQKQQSGGEAEPWNTKRSNHERDEIHEKEQQPDNGEKS